MRTKGKITHWNEQKGYGFITPAKGTDQVFVHIRAFSHRQNPPKLNQSVSFSMSTDQQGRPCAVKVTRTGEKRPKARKRKRGFFKVLIAIAFIAGVAISVKAFNMHIYVLYLYLAASALTFLVYAKDKWAAKRDAWRTPEGTLQGLALIGGWPGALIAQQLIRHKSRKAGFQATFWVVVVVNCGGFAWALTADGQAMLRSIIASFK